MGYVKSRSWQITVPMLDAESRWVNELSPNSKKSDELVVLHDNDASRAAGTKGWNLPVNSRQCVV